MKYQNPVISGMNPDPSICYANGKYYLVTSSFEFFPALPIYESDNLINWKLVNYVILDESQLDLTNRKSSLGIYAPTIRYNKGRFYVVTTDVLGIGNFLMVTDDIYSKWGTQIKIQHEGIDPSLYFENDIVYFCATAQVEGKDCITLCEIDIENGQKRTEDKIISFGIESRNVEGPHIYKYNNYYYILASEGGTEYGHLITQIRSKDIYGPYETCPELVLLTHRNNLDEIQAVGHGDLIFYEDEPYLIHLGIRKIGWQLLHNLGRETFLTPLKYEDNGWFYIRDEKVLNEVETKIEFREQNRDFEDLFISDLKPEWNGIRKDFNAYTNVNQGLTIKGNNNSLNDMHPTLVAIRQPNFEIDVTTKMKNLGVGGISIYYSNEYHYDFYLEKGVLKLRATIHGLTTSNIINKAVLDKEVSLIVKADREYYYFIYDEEIMHKLSIAGMCTEQTSYMSFTGTFIALFAEESDVTFLNFKIETKKNKTISG